jgi:hypothetical protein
MDERRSIFYRPRRQAFLLILIVIVAYLLLLGPQGEARDVLTGEGYAFVSFGEHGGLRLFSLLDPMEPVEVGVYDSPGSARKIARVGSILYLADGVAGLRIVDVSNPRLPVAIGSVQFPGDAQDLALNGGYAYIASGTGIEIVDVSNPTNPISVGRLETPGSARGISVQTFIYPVPSPDPNFPEGTQVVAQFAFVADSARGVQVIDVQLPISPARVGNLDPAWDALDVEVVAPFGFIAAGADGLRVLDLSNPLEPLEIAAVDTPGEALSVKIQGTLALIADGRGGLAVFDVSIPAAPQHISTLEMPGDTQAIAAHNNIIYSANGVNGIRVIDFSSPFAPFEVSAIETPGEASLRQIGQAGFSILLGRWEMVESKVWQTLLFMGLDLMLFIAALLFFMAFFVQFVLPVRTVRDRGRAIHRLLKYIRGAHGPAIFIQDGVIRQSYREEDRRGPGVALLDTASAAVFRNAHIFTRAAGPGIIFTEANEYPAGTVDLHFQLQSIGPNENEDPFRLQAEEELPEAFNERQKRRYATSGLSRDGVEIVPQISVVFSLNTDQSVGNTWFGYNPEAVWRAVARQGISPDEPINSQTRQIPWKWLPPHLAADLWREYLRKFTLDELFALPNLPEPDQEQGVGKTAYDTIIERVQARMTHREVEELDEFGRRTGVRKPSKEYRILNEHGIKVVSIHVRHLRFPSRIEEQLIDEWSASWLQRARSEYRQIENLHADEKLAGQGTALKEFAAATTQMLGANLDEMSTDDVQTDLKNAAISLRMLLQGTLKLCIREPQLQQRLTSQLSELTEIIEWAGKQ